MAVVTLYDKGIESMYEIRGLAESRVESLNLHMNRLRAVENLDGAVARALTSLDVSSNDLQSLDGVEGLRQLAVLNVSANRLARLPDMARLQRLTRFVGSFNALTSMAGLGVCRSLEEVELDGNHIADLDAVAEEVALLPQLRKLVLQSQSRETANPVCAAAGYRARLLQAAPSLTHLDGTALGRACDAAGAPLPAAPAAAAYDWAAIDYAGAIPPLTGERSPPPAGLRERPVNSAAAPSAKPRARSRGRVKLPVGPAHAIRPDDTFDTSVASSAVGELPAPPRGFVADPRPAAGASAAGGDDDAASLRLKVAALEAQLSPPDDGAASKVDAALARCREGGSWRCGGGGAAAAAPPPPPPVAVGVAFVQTDGVVTHAMETQTADVVATERGVEAQADLLDLGRVHEERESWHRLVAGLQEVVAHGQGEVPPLLCADGGAGLLRAVRRRVADGDAAAASLAALRAEHASAAALLTEERRRAEELEAHGSASRQLRGALADARAAQEQLQRALERKTRSETELSTRLAAASLDIEAKNRELEKCLGAHRALEQQVASLHGDLSRAESTGQAGRAAAADLQQALGDAADRHRAAAERLKAAHAAAAAEAEESHRAAVHRLERQLAAAREEAREAAAAAAAQADGKYERTVSKLAAGYKDYKARAAKYQQLCKDRQEALDAAASEAAAAKREAGEQAERVASLQAARQELEGGARAAQQRLEQALREIHSLREDARRAQDAARQHQQAAAAAAHAAQDGHRAAAAALHADIHGLTELLREAKVKAPPSPAAPPAAEDADHSGLSPLREGVARVKADLAAQLAAREATIERLMAEGEEAKQDLHEALDSLEMEAEAKSRMEANLQASMRDAERAARDKRHKLEKELQDRDAQLREMHEAAHALKAEAGTAKELAEEEKAAARKLTIKIARLEEANEDLAAQLSRHGHDLKKKLRAVAEALQREKQASARAHDLLEHERADAAAQRAAADAAAGETAALRRKVAALEQRHQQLQHVLAGGAGH
eukprot:TRINITY_DN1462_c0_g2_i1.p1 TRINITY_DN1462_c0_g2~~TRINITY_DN1462_c0_g2_i1.p1  ORF type:complete len:1017 (+),score=418.91 TRINITY_DN1462_c0_g2_i1:123-3173(+)